MPEFIPVTLGNLVSARDCLTESCLGLLGGYLLRQVEGNPCRYLHEHTFFCNEFNQAVVFRLSLEFNNNSIVGVVSINGIPEAQWSVTGLTAPYNCSMERTLTINTDSGPFCQWIDVTFVKEQS
jgi:hypothetical protein